MNVTANSVNTSRYDLFSRRSPVIILALAYLVLAAFLGIALKFDFMTGDVRGYWQDSLDIRIPFHSFHVPGYPLTIAIVNWATAGRLSPIMVMVLINFTAYIASAYLVFQILRAAGANDRLAATGAYLFGLWPLVGLTYTVFPLADLPAIFFFLAGLYFRISNQRRFASSFFFGLAIIMHKAMWPLIGLIVLFEILYQKRIKREDFLSGALIILPLTVLWLSGAIYHRSLLWIVSKNLEVELASQSSLLLFDGLIGAFFETKAAGFFKGITVICFFLLTLGVLFFTLKFKYPFYVYSTAVSTFVLLLLIVLNQYEIWAAVRYSRLLTIPLVLTVNHKLGANLSFSRYRAFICSLLILLLASQIVYSWYIAKIFY